MSVYQCWLIGLNFLCFRSKTFIVNAGFFLFLTELFSVSYIFYFTHCHTILPTNWLLGNMALWMGCIFISVCSGLETLRGEKHPCCSLVSSVCSVATEALVDMSSDCVFTSSGMHDISTLEDLQPGSLLLKVCMFVRTIISTPSTPSLISMQWHHCLSHGWLQSYTSNKSVDCGRD